MPPRLSHTQLLRYAGLITWAMVGSGLVMNALFLLESRPEGLGFAAFAMPVAAYLLFGLAFWLATDSLVRARGRVGAIGLLLAMTVSALAVSLLTDSGLGAILMMIMAAVVPWLLPGWPGVAWLVLQHLPLVGIFMQGLEFRLVEALMQSLLYAGVSGFVYVAGLVAKQQAEAREEQRQLNAELRATRALLADSARVGERLRISRELHDLLGHHLTALSLNLEVAGHLSEGRVQEHVRQAHTLARLLLTDVREAVSAMRGEDRLDLGAALRTLAESVPALEVTVQIDTALPVHDAERAQVLLRCAQEIITNTLRHAQARRLWLVLGREGGMLRLSGRDDGIGGETVRAGNGLTGMRERLAAFGGWAEVATAPGQGFRIDIHLPTEAPA